MMMRYRRSALVLLFALAVLMAGMWTDMIVDGRTDLLHDLFSTGIALVFGLIVGDTALSVEEKIGCWPKPALLYALRIMAMSALWVWLGHALMPALALLVQIPRAGFEILPTVLLGIEYVLHTSLLPSAVLGAAVGLVMVRAGNKNATHPEPVEGQSASQTNNAS